MTTWRVTLSGDSWDLKSLAGLGLGVTEEGNGSVLRSPDLNNLTDAGAVRQRAIELVEGLNGIARVAVGDFDPVSVGAVLGGNGGSVISIFAVEESSVRDRAQGAVADAVTGHPVVSTPRPDHAKWAAIAVRDQDVRRALRFFAAPTTRVNLWKIYEVIRDDVGGKAQIVSNGWTTDAQIERFRSVHSVTAFGDQARHAVETQPPPANPMFSAEAAAFVRGLLEKWLASK